jgi:phosphoesterase RecJ-like protein
LLVVELRDVGRELKAARRLLFTGHVIPDGDCVGSMLALGLALEREGKEAAFVSPGPVPLIYSFLPGVDRVKIGPPVENGFDLVVVVDTSVPERLGDLFGTLEELRRSGSRILVMDHHLSARPFGDLNYFEPGAAAVGEIVFDLLKILNLKLDREIATCLYVAIATDTGGFCYETTTAATHRRVADLIEAGVDVRDVSRRLFEEKPFKSIEALRAALNNLELDPSGRVAWMVLDAETLKKLQVKDEHTDGLVNYARFIRGVEVALLFREVGEGQVKISFRSKKHVDVSRLAARFGGGGHLRAAGAVVKGDLGRVKEAVVQASTAAVAEAVTGKREAGELSCVSARDGGDGRSS